ncbi:DUF4395 family protein [Paenibacillus sp. SYP-B3998]|uniref:DUF4395 family protein n=1 Tax=Paenibacillus sp. SYP-B3998 TaxID=2678564 RepID=A0A6G3ZWN8_9BACL|nr:DUF4395 family protein [Paenibacillus sp. SYP-B3998]NEW06525.1 DUF4395 family protein [Paenibacillus sp. SYP-B3998]
MKELPLTYVKANQALGWVVIGYVFTGFLLLAAGAALLGYCIGCKIYYPYKIFLNKQRSRRS